MSVTIYVAESERNQLTEALRKLVRAIHQRLPETRELGGFMGGADGYGAPVETPIFVMRMHDENPPDCTCEPGKRTEASRDAWEEAGRPQDKPPLDEPCAFDCPFNLPEFHHKASGFMVWWHKWIGRSMKTAGSVANIANMIDECIASLPPLPKPGRGHLPRARVGACWVCGLKLCCGGWQYALISDEEFHEHAVHQVCIGEYPVIAESVGRAPKAAKKAQGDGR